MKIQGIIIGRISWKMFKKNGFQRFWNRRKYHGLFKSCKNLWPCQLNKEFCSSNGMKKYSLSSLIPISLASLEIFICLPKIKILGFSNRTSITNWSTDLGNILYLCNKYDYIHLKDDCKKNKNKNMRHDNQVENIYKHSNAFHF